MLTLDKLGIMLWLNSTLNGLQCNLSERDKSQILLSGSDSSNTVRVHHQDYSIMKFHTPAGSDSKVIFMTRVHPRNKLTKRSTILFIPSPMLIKTIK